MRTRLEPTDPAALAIDALATYRLTRLLVSDGIIDRPRQAFVDRLVNRRRTRMVELIECPWCTGFWVAAGVVVGRRVFPRAWAPVAEAFAFSAAAGLLASRVRSLDDTHDVVERIEDGELDAPALSL